MIKDDNRSSFDRLVAGLSSEDRAEMLNRINQTGDNKIQIVADRGEADEKHVSLQSKLATESIIYRFFLWLRSLFARNTIEQLYRDDLLSSIAKRIDRYHPGLINQRIKSLDYIFYERLKALKEASDFFKPYIAIVDENPGDFYVFLSTFVAPELSERINQEIDPFNSPVQKDISNDERKVVLKKLDDVLMNLNPGTKNKIYAAISAENWLKKFTLIPYIHFLAQFTNVAGNVYTCPYRNALLDYNYVASVFANTVEVENEVIEALFLFSQRKILNEQGHEKDIEKAVRDFVAQAAAYFSTIQSFVDGVPVIKLGRVVNNNYDWECENLEGVEGWFPIFRMQWKKIINIRWSDWVREQKKQNLTDSLRLDFGLEYFPVIEYRPWIKLWNTVRFNNELTGGFLSWFATEKFNEIIQPLNDVIMEGVFYKSENRVEFTESVEMFSTANNNMLSLIERLSPKGEYGKAFEEFEAAKVHTFQIQKQIDTMMENVETTIKDVIKLFGKSARALEKSFHGFFDEVKDGIHEPLQNMNSIKGHNNRQFRDNLMSARSTINKSLYYLSELEPIDNYSEA